METGHFIDFGGKLTCEMERQLFKSFQEDGNQDSYDKLFYSLGPLCVRLASEYIKKYNKNSNNDLNEYISVAYLCLSKI